MESAEEFIQRYLNEKVKLNSLLFETSTPFYENFFTKDYFGFYLDFFKKKEANPEQFVSVESSEQAARVITTESFDKRQNRSRYNLYVSNGRWEISSKEAECFVCHGNGLRGGKQCHYCEGKSWKNYAKTAI